MSDRRASWLAFAGVVVLTILFRLPALVNARGVHSDAAIVGLQAMHILKGEWSWFIWGAPYQGSFDAWAIAVAFFVAGVSALTLMLTPLVGYLAMTWFAYDILRRHLAHWSAFLAVLPLAFAPRAINSVALYAPRQWCITTVFASFWLLNGAHQSRFARGRYFLGAAIGVLALYLDLYALQFMLGLAVFAGLSAFDGNATRKERMYRFGLAALGLVVGAAAIEWILQGQRGLPAQAHLSWDRVRHNAQLMWNSCLPWVLSFKVYRPSPFPHLWAAPPLVHAMQILGAALFLAGIGLGGVAIAISRIQWGVRKLGLVGFTVAASSIAGFLLSGMPSDEWAARYLAPLVWMAPFALAPAAYLLSVASFGIGLAPYLASACIGGWLGFFPYVSGPFPVLDARGVARDEARVGEFLREQGIHCGAAQYWLSYRLTFLFGENPIVIPLNAGEDRYPPYRRQCDQAPVVAYIFHPSEPRAVPQPYEAALASSGSRYQRKEIAGFTILIHDRRAASVLHR